MKLFKDPTKYFLTGNAKPIPEENESTTDKYIWVSGYKATDYYMRGYNDFQYKLNEIYSLPHNEDPELCHKGFHFCLDPKYIKHFYKTGRIFKVRALIKETEYQKAKKWLESDAPFFEFAFAYDKTYNKMVAKSIQLIEELSIEQTREYFTASSWITTNADFLSYAQWVADKKHEDWFAHKFQEQLKATTDFSQRFIQILWDKLDNQAEKAKKVADLATSLYQSITISADLKIYLVLKEIEDLNNTHWRP